MQSNSFSYSLKVWLTSVFAAPVILIIINAFVTHWFSNQLMVYILSVALSITASFLTWIIFYFLIDILAIYFRRLPNIRSLKNIKYYFTALGVILTICNFVPLFLADFGEILYYLCASHCICIAAGSLFYNLEIDGEPFIIKLIKK